MFKTPNNELELQVNVLKQQLELEESNYKYAVELNEDLNTLMLLRQHIQDQRKILYELIEKCTQFQNNSTNTL